MKFRCVLILFVVVLAGCATSKMIKKSVPSQCAPVAKLSSHGFSIMPFVGSSIAESLLETKAKEYDADAIVIDEKTGFFNVKIEATGYRCGSS